MNAHPTPFERVIDALQIALLAARSIDQKAHDLAAESTRLVNALQHAGAAAHELRPSVCGKSVEPR